MELRLSEVLGALSHALDITEGQPRGHAERSCLIGMALAERLSLGDEHRHAIFYALLLKDAGCSSNAAKVAALYGADDAEVKRDRKVTDHLRPAHSIRHLVRATAPGAANKLRHLKALAEHGSAGSRKLTELRCERGAQVATDIGLTPVTAEAIRHLDEHWDGRGYPQGLQGEDISIAGRILCLAQTAEVFWQLGGRQAALDVADDRRGTWFDPQLVDLLHTLTTAEWASLNDPQPAAREPADEPLLVTDDRLDRIARAFATVVDAKSPYTGRHSEGVAGIAVALARTLDLDHDAQRRLHRAGLLHDIGKLGVSNRILDKPGKLTGDEWAVMRRHPEWSLSILARVPALAPIAKLAALHHERLDGRGYFRGYDHTHLDLEARILAVADVTEALSAERPYREALPPQEVLTIVERDAGVGLDAGVVAALGQVLTSLDGAGEPHTLADAA